MAGHPPDLPVPTHGNFRPNQVLRQERLGQLDELCDRFLDVYEAVAPVSRERVHLWEAFRLFTTVFHCWTKMETGLETRLELLGHHPGTTGLAP